MIQSTRRQRLVALAVLAALALPAGVGLYASLGEGTSGGACRASREAAARMAPLARGEVAALRVHESPRPAPALAFTDAEGRPTDLARLRGRTLLVNLWATWCAPCRVEMPALDRLQAALGGERFEVVAVNLDTRNLDRPRAWLRENGIEHLAYYADPEASALRALRAGGQEVGLPTTLVVDPRGCELAMLAGPAEWSSPDAQAVIRAAIGEGAAQ